MLAIKAIVGIERDEIRVECDNLRILVKERVAFKLILKSRKYFLSIKKKEAME
jgi:hypothetical protein